MEGAMMVTGDTTLSFEEALTRFLSHAQGVVNAYYARSFPTLSVPTLEIDPNGKRYVRIVRRDTQRNEDGTVTPIRTSGCCHCFIDRTNGDVLKSASWKAPAKGARGNIFGDYLRSMTENGAVYR